MAEVKSGSISFISVRHGAAASGALDALIDNGNLKQKDGPAFYYTISFVQQALHRRLYNKTGPDLIGACFVMAERGNRTYYSTIMETNVL
ncbi:MAG TPA: hypothetical protein VMR70_16990 [Flavisolibacter sp.]|nr:hypothetical protein [Flavisolibacter sp.]